MNCFGVGNTKQRSLWQKSMKLPYEQMVIGLDRLFFQGDLGSLQQANDRMETIDAYLEACGWTWDMVLEQLANEKTPPLPSPVGN